MSYSPISTEGFGGLNLLDDVGTMGWNQAVDMANVDLFSGRIRSRPGYTTFNNGAPNTDRYNACVALKTASSATPIVAYRRGAATTSVVLLALSGSGLSESVTFSIASIATGLTDAFRVVSYDTPAIRYAFAIDPTESGTPLRLLHSGGVVAWSRPAFTGTEAPTASAEFLAVTPWDNRLVFGRSATDAGRLMFSNAGDPLTFPTNNFISLPEPLTALATWQNLMFAFSTTAMYVFYGTSTDSSGNPIFNYRRMDIGAIGSTGMGKFCAAQDALYFTTERGLFKTTGDTPVELSRPIRPLFTVEATNGLYAGNYNHNGTLGIFEHANKIVVTSKGYSSAGATNTNGLWLIYDKETQAWSAFDFPNGGETVARVFDSLYFPNASGDKGFARMFWHSDQANTEATTDNGTSITSRYRSGFSDLGSPKMKTVREWILDGIGSPTLQTSHDFGSLETGAAVTLGTSPATSEGRRRSAVRGRQVSWQVGGTTAWTLNNLTANVREQRLPGVHSAA